MRKRRRLSALLAVLVLLAGACGAREKGPEEGVRLWFPADDSLSDYGHGPALDSEPCQGELPPEPGQLLAALLAGPARAGLRSPFPRGVTVRSCGWDGERPGVLLVELSEQYGALADISLTLADYCIVLTLSQVEGVEAVEITSAEHAISYRSHQVLTAREAVLWDELAQAAPPGPSAKNT